MKVAAQLSSDEEVEYLDRPTKRKTEHTAPRIGSKRTSNDYANTLFIQTEPKRIRQSPTIQHGQPEITPAAFSPPPPSPPPRTGGSAKRPRTQVSNPTPTQATDKPTTQTKRHKHAHYPTTGHFIARNCITDTFNPHWEGDRNDQCQACDAGGTLTECTRCNIVWHASCLQPPLPFPLRKQDAIVCGDACWAELMDESKTRGASEPVKEDTLNLLRFLPRRHSNTTPTTQDYPSVTSRNPQGESIDSSTTSKQGQHGEPPLQKPPHEAGNVGPEDNAKAQRKNPSSRRT